MFKYIILRLSLYLNSRFIGSLIVCYSIAFLNTSCVKEGACEVKFDLKNGSFLYSCENDRSEDYCSASSSAERAFHEGMPCSSLGYLYETKNGSFTAEDGNYDKPGANGVFQNDLNSGVGGALAGCTGSYDGPTFDIQIDSQCQTAYAYTCSGFKQGVDAACAIYKIYQQDDPSIPKCPYCG